MLRARIDEMLRREPVVAELKTIPPAEGISLSRWSRLKRAAADERAALTAVRVPPVEALVASETSGDRLSPNGNNDATANADYAELPPISTISLAEDFTPFMQAKVPQALKQQALKALFKEPHFNVMDGLDIYIDDYTVFEPISPEVMATLSSWKTIMNPPQQVVTSGGYAVDVESEEGKAVLAARAELAEVSTALPPPQGGVEVSSPAARSNRHVASGSGAEGEGGESAELTSQTINAAAIDDTPQLSDETHANTLTPTPAQTCAPVPERAAGEGAKPHPRYGKRVGDFSASGHEAAEAAARESSLSDPFKTPSAAPKTIIQ